MVVGRRLPAPFPWLLPKAQRELAHAWALDTVGQPRNWTKLVRWVCRMRYIAIGNTSLDLIAADQRATIFHPFLDERFCGSIARLPRDLRYRGRSDAMSFLLGDLLPDSLLERRTKASFDGAFWTDYSRAFTRDWSGRGVNEELIDTDALRAEWARESPDARTYTLLQAAWLADSAPIGARQEAAQG
jgi:asparagine synthase (glutamine-hydrolysing)